MLHNWASWNGILIKSEMYFKLCDYHFYFLCCNHLVLYSLYFLLSTRSDATRPTGGAWQPLLQYVRVIPPVQPVPLWLHLSGTTSPCHSLPQAPPTAAAQLWYSQQELFKQACCALTERQGPQAGGWHSRRVKERFLLAAILLPEAQGNAGLGSPCCHLVSAYILKSAARSWRRCSEVLGCQHWMDTTWGQRRLTTLSLRVSTWSLCRPWTADHHILRGFSVHCYFWSCSFTLQITLPCLVLTQRCPITWISLSRLALYIHISLFQYAHFYWVWI